jgi:hypothetical protein
MNLEVQQKVLKWLMKGENVGNSSKAMAAAATGHIGKPSHPYDPADFNRCLVLCHQVPEVKDNFHLIKEISPTWSKLIDRWDEVEKCFIDEAGFNWSKSGSAPKTYKLLKSIIR